MNTERDRFLTKAMGLQYGPAISFHWDNRPWEMFGILWEWAINQGWFGTFSKLHTIGQDKDNTAILQIYVNPDRFADAICKFLQEPR